MATISIVLAILIVHCAIVMSEPQSAEQEMAIVIENQRQLLMKIDENDANVAKLEENVKQLQADVKGLKAKFKCHFSAICKTCKWAIFIAIRRIGLSQSAR